MIGRKADPVIVIGAGGHGRVVVSTLQACGLSVSAVADDDPGKHGRSVLGVPVIGPVVEVLAQMRGRAVIGVGDNLDRHRLATALKATWASAFHPTAWIAPDATCGNGTVVFAGAVVQSGTVIGDHAIINTGAVVDHDCRIGSFAHIAPGVAISGGAEIGTGALIGVGASIAPGCRVGEWAVVGAGAAVVGDIPERVTAVGVPARPVAS